MSENLPAKLDPELYRVKSEQDQEKERERIFRLLKNLPKWGLLFFAKSVAGLLGYAKSQKIDVQQALDEAVLALPKQFPDAIEKVSDWVAICDLAGIPAVPCYKGPRISLEELEVFADRQLATPATDTLALWIRHEFDNGHVWRWECCAPEHLKLYAGLRRVEPRHQNIPKIPFQVDERLFHILWGQQATEVSIVSRPWVKPMMDDGFPVEFRVFHTKDGDAACNYYPQRRMSEQFRPFMEKAVELTRKLAAFAVPAKSGLPTVPAEFSCDWMLRADGELVFLEAGPPHANGGAHPCCFGLIDGKGAGPLPGKRLLTSEPGAQFYVDDRVQSEIDRYKQEKQDFYTTVKRLKANPRQVAALMMVQGIIPREMAEKVIVG